MKKILLLVLAFAIAVPSMAQIEAFGVKGGLNFTNLNSERLFDDSDGRTSFNFGAFAEFGVADQLTIRPELYYSAQGANTDLVIINGLIDFETTWRVNYLNLPILGKYEVIEGLGLMTGPQFGFLLKSEAETDTPIGDIESDTKDDTEGLDFSWVFGAVYRLDMGLEVGLRYNLGLSNINDSFFESDEEIRNRVFQITVGYSIAR